MRGAPQEGFVLLYDFAAEHELIAQMQKVSLDSSSSFGLSPEPLVGSEEWWDEIASDRRPIRWIEGVIDSVWWGSMADYPEFSIRAEDGTTTTWTRLGNGRRYVEGIRARLSYVEHPWKAPEQVQMEGPRDVVLQIWLEDAQRRSSGIAPGPGGVGYQLARDQGKVVHYLEFPSQEAAEQALSALGDDGQTHRGPYRTGPDGPWVIDAWDVEGTSLSRFRELAALAADRGGRYDGGEVVEGGSGVQPVPKPDESLAARQMQFQETARRGRVPGSIGTIPRAPANDSDRFA